MNNLGAHLAMLFDQLFNPRSVAVVGVSEDHLNLGRAVVGNLIAFGFPGEIHCVGRKGGTVHGRAIRASVLDLPQPVDLAAILVPAAAAPEVLEHCGQMGISWAVLMAGGFSEFGQERHELEAQIAEICGRYGMGLIGPNCVGVMDAHSRLAATFAPVPVDVLRAGPVAILAQSGSVAMEMATLLSRHRLGFSKYVSLGNKLLVSETDLLRYLIQEDERTKQIALYLEGISDGRAMFELARHSSKPIVLQKANIVPGGNAAAKSHTASLASDDVVVDAACRQANVVRARTFDNLLSYSKAMALPPMRGNRVAIVVNSGGAGVVTADFCYLHGFEMPALPDEVLAGIEARTKTKVVKRGNPLDLGDIYDRGVMLYAAEALLSLPQTDGLLLCVGHAPLMPMVGPSVATMVGRLCELGQHLGKPVAVSFSPILYQLDGLRERLPCHVFTRPEEAVIGLALSRDHWRRSRAPVAAPPGRLLDRKAMESALANLPAVDGEVGIASLGLLQAIGVPAALPIAAASAPAAVAAAHSLGYPVALKLLSPQISHKSDVGGVALALSTDALVEEAFAVIRERCRQLRPDATFDGVAVQKMAAPGHEVLVGIKRDPQFGPAVVFGLGGFAVELLDDFALRLAPLNKHEAEEMISSLKSSPLLHGFRGQPAADVPALVDVLLRVSQLAVEAPSILELDVNPLLVGALGQGCLAVDARLVLRKPART